MRKKWVLEIHSNFSEFGLPRKKVFVMQTIVPFKKAFYEKDIVYN